MYFAWEPVLPSDDRAAAQASSARVPDPRVRHYWDDGLRLGIEMGEALRIPPRPTIGHGRGVAWDSYLLYPPGPVAGAAGKLPVPRTWLHQISHLPPGFAPRLDAATLRGELERLGASSSLAPSTSPASAR